MKVYETDWEGGLFCDFCRSNDVVVAYPAKSFITKDNEESAGWWAACGSCQLLIDENQWGLLFERVMEQMLELFPEFQPAPIQKAVAAKVRELQEHFRVHQTGAALPIPEVRRVLS